MDGHRSIPLEVTDPRSSVPYSTVIDQQSRAVGLDALFFVTSLSGSTLLDCSCTHNKSVLHHRAPWNHVMPSERPFFMYVQYVEYVQYAYFSHVILYFVTSWNRPRASPRKVHTDWHRRCTLMDCNLYVCTLYWAGRECVYIPRILQNCYRNRIPRFPVWNTYTLDHGSEAQRYLHRHLLTCV